jgi:molybdate transport system permease protein
VSELFFHFTAAELTALSLSLRVAVYSSLLSLPVALPIGYTLARHSFYGKSVIESILHLSLVMPPVTTGYLLLLVLGTRGIAGKWLHETFGIRLAFSFAAAVIASVVVSFPLMVRSVRTAMEMVDRRVEEASATLGAGRVRTFLLVTVPMALPGIISGSILSFARSLGEFGATITFAGNIRGETQTLPLAIYTCMQIPGKEGATMHLVLVSVLVSFIAMLVSEWVIRRMRRQ